MHPPIKQRIEEFLDHSSEEVLELLLDARNSDRILKNLVFKYWDRLQEIWATSSSGPYSSSEAYKKWERYELIPLLVKISTGNLPSGTEVETGLHFNRWLKGSLQNSPESATRNNLTQRFRKECSERGLQKGATIPDLMLYDIGKSLAIDLPSFEEFQCSPQYARLRTFASKERYSRKKQSS